MELIRQEIREQPAIARARGAAPPPVWPSAGRVVVTGCGDSLAAAELAAELWPELGLLALPALEASRRAGGLGRDAALIGISASGRTPRVVEALARARAGGARAIAVCDDPSGPVGAVAHEVWASGASPIEELQSSSYADGQAAQYVGYHHDVAQTKTFLAGVLTLARAAEAALRGRAAQNGHAGASGTPGPAGGATDWQRLAALLDALTDASFAEALEPAAVRLARATQAFFLGGGSTLPLARFAAYKMFEYDRVAHFADVEEYCHTHYFVTRPGDALVFVVHDGDGAARTAEVAPVLTELFDARCFVLAADDVELASALAGTPTVRVPAGRSALERHVALIVGIQWLTYLWGRVGAPDIDTFHAGFDTERLVAGSLRTIRRSAVRP